MRVVQSNTYLEEKPIVSADLWLCPRCKAPFPKPLGFQGRPRGWLVHLRACDGTASSKLARRLPKGGRP